MCNQIVVYAVVPLEKLKPGVNRPLSWYDGHPEFIAMRSRLVSEFKTIGLMNALSCIADKKVNRYTVTVGNQRLEALRYGGFSDAPCIISFLNDCELPENSVELSKNDIYRYFKSGVKRVVWKHSMFQIVPNDTDEYDPHKQN